MKASEARKLIGKAVSYKNRFSSFPARVGIIEEQRGCNVRIDSNWLWLPDFWIEPIPVLSESENVLALELDLGPTS
jgi:hypothetical protein